MGGDVEEETEGQYEQLLGEVGLEMVGDTAVSSSKMKGGAGGTGGTGHNDISDLEKQLQNLKD